jgi:hypothetical protein
MITFLLWAAAAMIGAAIGLRIHRILLRVAALRAAVAFYQAPGTNGNVIKLAEEMARFLARGRK